MAAKAQFYLAHFKLDIEVFFGLLDKIIDIVKQYEKENLCRIHEFGL